MLARLAQRPLALTWLERLNAPEQWRWLAERAERSVAAGVDVRLQAASRAIGLLNGLDTSFNALVAFPSYRAIAHLPPAERAARMREPGLRGRILSEPRTPLSGEGSSVPPLADEILARIDEVSMLMFPFPAGADDVPDYEPDPRRSFGAQARARGERPLALIYDWLAAGDGTNLVYFPIFNYLRGSLDTVHAMLTHPLALAALGDAGAHVGTVCDASMPTTLLSHWVRDRRDGRIALPAAIEMLSARNARHMGLADRGTVAPGARADLNLIDPTAIALEPPRLVRDLPAGGRRFVQGARGYRATLVAGEPVVEFGQLTGAAGSSGPGGGSLTGCAAPSPGGGGRRSGSRSSADFTSRCAEIGAVRNTNTVISSSWTTSRCPVHPNTIIDASSAPPTPSVLALVGACRRMYRSRSLTRPIAPTSAKPPPASSSRLATSSTAKGRGSACIARSRSVVRDDVAAAHEARGDHRADEAEHRDHQRRLEVDLGAELDPEQHDDRERVHVQGVEREHAVEHVRADEQPPRAQQHRDDEHGEGQGQRLVDHSNSSRMGVS